MKNIIILIILLFFSCQVFASDEYGQVDIHGFISQGYLKSSDYNFYYAETEDGTFQFNEMGITFSTELTDSLRLGMQFLAKDLGVVGNDEITIDWAFADYQYSNWLSARIGKMKIPYGIYNARRDIDFTRTTIFLPSSVYHENYRETQLTSKGIGIYGILPGNFEYQAIYGMYNITKDGGVALKLKKSLTGYDPSAKITGTDIEPAGLASVRWNTPLEGLSIGSMLIDFDFDINATLPLAGIDVIMETTGFARIYSIEYFYENLVLSVEHMNRLDQVNMSLLNFRKETEAYYISATYRFADWFETAIYYSANFNDKDDKNGKDGKAMGEIAVAAERWLKDWSLSLRFDVNDSWVIKLEVHFMDGLLDVENFDINDPDENWMLYAAKFSFSF